MYEWAGEFRTVDIFKEEHGFAPADHLESYAEELLGQIREANMFAGRDRAGVVEGLMYTMQAVNIVHPFREGNGRTQRIMTEHIAEHAGYVLDWTCIDPSPAQQRRCPPSPALALQRYQSSNSMSTAANESDLQPSATPATHDQ